ncbi:Alpha/Beta hydrolase protein, partial [Triangularia verruculosa]
VFFPLLPPHTNASTQDQQGKITLPPSRYEFTTVYSHPSAKADIVLVHGLNGDPLKTWTSRENGVYWPTDLLPAALKDQHANILVYGYNADVYSSRKTPSRSPSDNFIHQHAQSLITSLTHHRKADGTERNPIIWVAHSLGGILVKRALLYSNDVRAHHQEGFRGVFVSTYGIIFLGTPHNGSDVAIWGRVLQAMSEVAIPRKLFETQSVLLKALKKDNETLREINGHFLDVYQRWRVQMVHECHTSDVRGSKILVVGAASAGPQLPGVTYYGIEKDHSGMCKFEGENAPGWKNVSTTIRQWVADGVNLIPPRWLLEEKDRQLRASLENFERARPYVSLSSEYYLICCTDDSYRRVCWLRVRISRQLVGCHRFRLSMAVFVGGSCLTLISLEIR